MRAYPVFIFIFFYFIALSVNGQDLHFSQFPYSPLNLSAAQTANFDGDFRAGALLRRQWAAVTVPYQTFSLGADAKLTALNDRLKGLGAGLLINQDVAGDGHFQTLQAMVNLSYTLPLGKDSVHFLRGGCSLGFAERSIDFNNLNFDSQFDGSNFNPQLSGGEIPERTHFSYFDAGAALGWTIIKKKVQWNADLHVAHLNEPQQQFLSTENVKLPMLFQLSTNDYFNVNRQVTLVPAANIMMQQKFFELNIGMEARLLIRDEVTRKYLFGAGLFVRTKDAIIPMIAVYYNKFRVGFSYDINLSPLKTASNGKGGPEISITYISKKVKVKAQHTAVCPVY